MRKIFRIYAALALFVMGAVSMSAGERIPVDADHFTFHDHGNSEAEPNFGWDANAVESGVCSDANFILGTADGCPIGDTRCNAWIELGSYSKLYVKMEGCDENGNPNGTNPRIFINRTTWNGQFNADKAQAKCLVIPNAGTWAEDYYSVEDDGTYVINLTKIAKEWGFVHFHSIKGSAWNTKAIVYSIEVEKAEKSQQVGWVDLINNGDMEGEDNSSFFSRIWPDNAMPVPNSEIVDGVGVDGSRGIQVAATAKNANAWDNQFWFRFNEPMLPDAKYRVTFDYRADTPAKVSTQAHEEPGNYIHYDMFGDLNFTTEWQTFTKEATVTAQQSTAEKQFLSVAFNLNELADANNYYFDNIHFEVYKYGTTAEFSNDVVLIDFGFDTNIPALVQACGKQRLMYPLDCAQVKVNGEPVEIFSVEGFADGRFYVFLNEPVNFDDAVTVSFNNPTDAAYHIIYTSGPGGDATNFADVEASHNEEVENNDGFPYAYLSPSLVKADPEDGSFNLPNSIRDFKLVFDKPADCAAIEATINGQPLNVTPATGFAEEITLSRTDDGDLVTGEYIIEVSKVYPEMRIDDDVYNEYKFTLSVGKVEYDPNDVPKEVLTDYFASCGANSIPEGYVVVFGEEVREGGSSFGSGSRMFDFAAGGDFTKGLYFREGYVEYGSVENHALTLEAGKRYQIHFNSTMWKDNGTKMRFEIFNQDLEQVLVQVVENKPNVNGSTAAVNGSTSTDINFVPEATGNYILRWTSAGNETDAAGYLEVILANPRVKYIPNQIGIEETQLLNTALDNAKATRDGNADERYDGEAFDALVAAIEKYEAEKDGYTAPSAYRDAAAVLDAASQALKDHRALCDNYDVQIKKAIDVQRQNEMPDGDPAKATKFVSTDLFAQLKDIVAKYHGVSEWKNVADTEADPEAEPIWQLFYEYDVLKNDAELTPAIAELTDIANVTSLLFTVGVSAPDNANGGKATGVAVLTDRLRLGALGLQALGVADDDPLVVAANNALTDDDDLALTMQQKYREIIFGQLRQPDNQLFAAVMDTITLEESTPEYDLTIFVKNPNIYKTQTNTVYSEENVPGWVSPEGFNAPGLSTGWSNAKNVEGVAEDCMFQTWGSSYRVEQTIYDLPAGVYSIVMGFGERNGEADLPGSFIYAKTTDTPWADTEAGEEEQFAGRTDATVIGQAFPFLNTRIDGIQVTDGILTIGANGGSTSHTFLNDVRIYLTGAIDGYDYDQAYKDGIADNASQAAQVKSVEVFSLDGRRMSSAKNGFVILRKHMSDGTVRIQKVVRK